MSLSVQRRGFVPVSDHLVFVVDRVTVGLVSVFQNLSFCLSALLLSCNQHSENFL